MTAAPTAQAVLNVARSQLGFVEGPANAEPFGPAIGYPSGVAWCDQWVSYCAWRAGAQAIIGRWQYCPSHVQWFKARGQWGTTPKVGAIVFYSWNANGVADHVGIVESVPDAGHITAIEGNTGNPGSAPGARDGVWRRTRSTALVLGYGYPAYGTPIAPPVPLPRPAPHTQHVYPLVVDGAWGPVTTRHLQAFLHVGQDGKLGPVTARALQRGLGVHQDGAIGPVTKRTLQRRLGVATDGAIGPVTVKALQRFLNRNL